jgi:hypothetical protein
VERHTGNGSSADEADADLLRAVIAEQTITDVDQASFNEDASAADADRTRSEADQLDSASDRAALDRDQAARHDGAAN